MSHSVILGAGEVGKSLAEVLSGAYTIYQKDVAEVEIPKEPCQVLHVALNFVGLGRSEWFSIVGEAIGVFRPGLVDVLSTVPPDTTRLLGPMACHSTTRGLHPHLADGIRVIPKHIGGPRASDLAAYYSKAGVRCVVHRKPETTEVAHIAHLLDYGLQLMSADARNSLCRQANVDYMEAVVKYTDTHNSGFRAMDMESKCRMNLTPPNGRIGGHCVAQAAKLAKEWGFSHPLCDMLARYNDV